MSKFIRKPTQASQPELSARYEKYGLKENPFPPEPTVNWDSDDKRINGDIYESEIRRKEYEQIENVFLKQNLTGGAHLRLGFIVDTSYIGRGNGKSAFLVNLQSEINREFCLDISEGRNKCFAVYVQPQAGGRTKTFASFIDTLFDGMLHSNLIEAALTSLKLEAIGELYPNKEVRLEDDQLVTNLASSSWLKDQGFDEARILEFVSQNKLLQDLPPEFPLAPGGYSFFRQNVTQKDFETYYLHNLKKGQDRLDFFFSHLVRMFQAASFNGGFVLVDDFERIPDFQSARQKKDFALELRTALYDGISLNARIGFYNFILVLHAGVPALISDAWSESGMEARAPISPVVDSNHIIKFEKLNKDHAILMVRRYLAEYRFQRSGVDPLVPFSEAAITRIGELSEYNAAKILKMCYELLERATTENKGTIDDSFVTENKAGLEDAINRSAATIENTDSLDLQKKIQGS